MRVRISVVLRPLQIEYGDQRDLSTLSIACPTVSGPCKKPGGLCLPYIKSTHVTTRDLHSPSCVRPKKIVAGTDMLRRTSRNVEKGEIAH